MQIDSERRQVKMKKIFIFTVVFLLLFSVNIFAQEAETLNTKAEDLKATDLSQEKSFSQSAREELLGIASQYDSEEDLDRLEIENFSFTAENEINDSQKLNLLSDLNLNANYSKNKGEELETAADFQLEYALNSRTLIRAGYSLMNEEGWNLKRANNAELKEDPNTNSNSDSLEEPADPNQDSIADQNNIDTLNRKASNSDIKRVYQNDLDTSTSLGLAYKTNKRMTVSADFIENNEFGSYYDDNWEIAGDSTVFGLEYNYPEGSTIRARYQVDTAEAGTQKITGIDFAFNNLATFSASYKLLNLNELEDTLSEEKTAWDLGLGFNLSDSYGLNLGYELIESENQKEEPERKIKASFEIDF